MIHKKERVYSRYSRDAALLLGKHIRLGRKDRGFTEADLANRIGISRATLQKIEKGDPRCELGLVFEAATLVGVVLFDAAPSATSFASTLENVSNKIALLPARVRKKQKGVNDDF